MFTIFELEAHGLVFGDSTFGLQDIYIYIYIYGLFSTRKKEDRWVCWHCVATAI